MADTVQWLSHEFRVYPYKASWNDVSGVYIFVGLNEQNQWVPLYVGQADSFRTRIPGHEQWSPAVRLGATHAHAMAVQQESQRDDIERQLIEAYQPSLNTQLR